LDASLKHLRTTLLSWLAALVFKFEFKLVELCLSEIIKSDTGYVLTRESLKRLVEQGLDQKKCKEILAGSLDDLIICKDFLIISIFLYFKQINFLLADCLKDLGAIFADTRDQWGLQRFIPFNPENLYNINGLNMMTIRKYDTYPVGKVTAIT
jgi:hypothetical protein